MISRIHSPSSMAFGRYNLPRNMSCKATILTGGHQGRPPPLKTARHLGCPGCAVSMFQPIDSIIEPSWTRGFSTKKHVYTYTYMLHYIHIYIYTYIYIYIYKFIYIYMYTYTYIYIHMYMYMSI